MADSSRVRSEVGTAFFVGETEAEGGGAEIFQGAADIQAFAANFSAGGRHGGGAALGGKLETVRVRSMQGLRVTVSIMIRSSFL